MTRTIVVAVTGASGAIYAEKLLDQLSTQGESIDEVAMVFSTNAEEIWNSL